MLGLIFAIMFGCFLSCKDEPTKPPIPPSESFSLHISVKDTAGNPVRGLQINGGNLLPRNLDPSHRLITSAIYKLTTISQDTSTGLILFRDSILIVNADQDIVTNQLGYTSSDGTFSTKDSTLFPNLFNYGFYSITHDNPDILGNFSILDTVQFVLRDTSNYQGAAAIFYVAVKRGKNEFSFVWEPTTYSVQTKTNNPLLFFSTPSKQQRGDDTLLWNKISIHDSAGRQKDLFLARADLVSNPDYSELPPLPPYPGLDVRFSTNHTIRAYPLYLTPDSIYIYRIKIQSGAYPLTFKWNFVDQPAPFELTSCPGENQIGTYTLFDSGTIKLNDPTLDCLVIKLIAKNKLSQNYPNPFTRSTSVRFFVYQPSYVTMKLHKLTGEVISILVNHEYFPPGYHTKQFQIDNLK